jgi:CRISPR-associated endonuclease/helicase Cas3
VKGHLPSALDLPTGLGKTSVMSIWLIARAHGAKLPCRLVYVVDRRAVVDQATDEAEKLRKALEGQGEHFDALDGSTQAQAKQTAAELKKRLSFNKDKLPISTLRGAYVDNREWLDDPSSPAIIIGTVDMTGSRLLFSGYGVSRKMRPYHAGLLGADALVVLDEAHLVPPFERLLEAIETSRRELGPCPECDPDIVPPFKLLSLSATGRQRDGETFTLDESDLGDEIVAKRLQALKAIQLVETADRKLEEALADEAWRLTENGAANVRCLIYCDSREKAEGTERAVKRLAEGHRQRGVSKISIETELFVGARRVKERDDAKQWLKCHGFLAGSDVPRQRPTFLIATSAGEVGVDLDADHMVCDLVPWERMVQRLGRVNRRGDGNARIIVVDPGKPQPKKADEPTPQEERDLRAYRSLDVIAKLRRKDGRFDASPGALRNLKLRAKSEGGLQKKIDEATTPEPLRPALNRALVDAWSMTFLETHTGRPDVAPWLRGWVEDVPQTTIVWRRHLPVREGVSGWPRTRAEEKEIEDFFEAAALHESEKLETETYRVVGWLQERANDLMGRKRKPPDQDIEVEDTSFQQSGAPDNLKESGAGAAVAHAKPLRRNDIVALVLSPSGTYGGRYSLGELAQERIGKAKDELESNLIGKILIVAARFGGLNEGLLDSSSDNQVETADDAKQRWSKEARFRVQRVESLSEEEEGGWRFEGNFILSRDGEGVPLERLVVEHFRDSAQREDARSIAKPQELARHQEWARKEMLRIATGVGLSGAAATAFAIGASLHDEGKRTARWQRAFRAPRDASRFGLTSPLAKTRGPIDQAILDGYRHEFGSLPHVEQSVELKALPDDWRELVLHLVAAHHGQARPSIETRGCDDSPPSLLEERACGVTLRFARLQKRWGPWGLAWWEALLRAADQQASRRLEEEG